MDRIKELVVALGPLRTILLLSAFLCLVTVQTPGTIPQYEGFAAFTTLIMPVMAPLVVVLLLLDALMAQVFRVGGDPARNRHYLRIIWIHLGAATIVTLVWLPYYLAIFD